MRGLNRRRLRGRCHCYVTVAPPWETLMRPSMAHHCLHHRHHHQRCGCQHNWGFALRYIQGSGIR